MLTSGFFEMVSSTTDSFVRRTADREVSFALPVSGGDDEEGVVRCLAATLDRYVAGAVGNIRVEERRPQPNVLVVVGRAKVEFQKSMLPDGDSPVSPSDSYRMAVDPPLPVKQARRRPGHHKYCPLSILH